MLTIDFGLMATVLGVLGTLGGLAAGVVKMIQRLSAVEARLTESAGAMQVLCKGVYASLDGLKQQGCNGLVTQAHKELQEMLFGK